MKKTTMCAASLARLVGAQQRPDRAASRRRSCRSGSRARRRSPAAPCSSSGVPEQRAAHVDPARDHEQRAEQRDEGDVVEQRLLHGMLRLRAVGEQQPGEEGQRQGAGDQRPVLVVAPTSAARRAGRGRSRRASPRRAARWPRGRSCPSDSAGTVVIRAHDARIGSVSEVAASSVIMPPADVHPVSRRSRAAFHLQPLGAAGARAVRLCLAGLAAVRLALHERRARGAAARRHAARGPGRGREVDHRALRARQGLGRAHHDLGAAQAVRPLLAQRRGVPARRGLGLRLGREGHDRDQCARARRQLALRRDARRRLGVRGQRYLRRQGTRHRDVPHRRAARKAQADSRRHREGPQGRPEGLRHRQPLRPRPHAHDRRDQRTQSRDRHRPRGRAEDHPRRDPDRRGDQPGQLGRCRCSTAPAG